jgi:hypothetical protein
MEPIVCPETSVRSYHYWLRNNPEERSYLLRGGSLKSITQFGLNTRVLLLREISRQTDVASRMAVKKET